MARGKHKARASNQRKSRLDATIDQLRIELEMERTALAEAETTREQVTGLQADLKQVNLALTDEVAPYAAQLRDERDYLRSIRATLSARYASIHETWNRYTSAAIDLAPGATGLERIESLNDTLGVGGWLNTVSNREGGRQDIEKTTRIQRARRERTNAAQTPPGGTRVDELKLLLDVEGFVPAMVRPVYLQHLIEQGVVTIDEKGNHQVLSPAEATSEQKVIREEALDVALRIWESRAGDLGANSVHVWGSGGLITTASAPAGSLHSLGFTAEADSIGTTPASEVSIGLPLPSTPAVSRRALAGLKPESVLEAWRGVLKSRRVVTERLGLASNALAPLAHHPYPSQGIAVQNAYALAAFAEWLRVGTPGVYAQAAVGITAAATYWLPAGQTASFAESEALGESDRAEMVLPFPQVFLAFAEPLLLEPDEPITAETETRSRMLSQVTHDVVRDNMSAREMVSGLNTQLGQEDLPAPTLDEMISKLGAHIEGVLLLADSLGRAEDLFAWCLAIPGKYGASLGRFVIPALRSTTEHRDAIDNLTAVVAWAQWHEPDQSTAVPLGITMDDLEGLVSSSDFQRNAKRAGTGIRVVDVGTTHRGPSPRQGVAGEESDAHVTPHIRRGHWRRQRFGAGLEQSKHIRIAPVLVNAHRGDVAPRVYRLRKTARRIDLETTR